MRVRAYLALVITGAVLAACGDTDETATSPNSDVMPQPDLDMIEEAFAITAPPNGSDVGTTEFATLGGQTAAGDAQGTYAVSVIGLEDPSDEAFYEQEFEPDAATGEWSIKIRLYEGLNDVSVIRLPPGRSIEKVLPSRGTRGYFILDWELTRSG
jgi:hypothetical protein